MDKEAVIHTHTHSTPEYCPAIKREVMPLAATWMGPEITLLSQSESVSRPVTSDSV